MQGATIITGVIGVDSHITGNWLLRLSLEEAGFRVVGLGAATQSEEFINAAIETDAAAILISSLYGHAPLDCQGFREKCTEAGLKNILLYIGGQLVVGKHEWAGTEKLFRDMGFNRVYPPGTLPATAIADLKNDLAALGARATLKPGKPKEASYFKRSTSGSVPVKNEKWPLEKLFEKRKEILSWWPTGKEIEDLDEAIAYARNIPDYKNFAKKLEKASKQGKILLQVGCGHATVEETIHHALKVQEAGADFIMLHQDSYTRKTRFDLAQKGLDESLRQGKSLLNGYPLVNHGVKNARKIRETIDMPIRFEGCSDEAPMLAREIGLAAGWTCDSSRDFGQLVAHTKVYPLDKRIENAQYNNRLGAYYTEKGAPFLANISTSVQGMCPQGIHLTIGVLQSLLTAEQGVKHILLAMAPQYNLVHDVACIKVLRELVREYLDKAGHQDVILTSNCWSYQGSWPEDDDRAAAVVSWNVATGVLAGVDFIQQKSIHEGTGIPVAEANAATVRMGKQILKMLENQRLGETEELKLEKYMMRLEVKAIVDRVLELGNGDLAVGEVKAAEQGVLDVPFPAWAGAMGKVVPVRDRYGINRYLNPGNLPIPKEVMDYHKKMIAERAKEEGMQADLELLIKDAYRISGPVAPAKAH